MYSAPDFVKVSTKVQDIFAAYCTASYGAWGMNGPECEGGSAGFDVMGEWGLDADTRFQCYNLSA